MFCVPISRTLVRGCNTLTTGADEMVLSIPIFSPAVIEVTAAPAVFVIHFVPAPPRLLKT